MGSLTFMASFGILKGSSVLINQMLIILFFALTQPICFPLFTIVRPDGAHEEYALCRSNLLHFYLCWLYDYDIIFHVHIQWCIRLLAGAFIQCCTTIGSPILFDKFFAGRSIKSEIRVGCDDAYAETSYPCVCSLPSNVFEAVGSMVCAWELMNPFISLSSYHGIADLLNHHIIMHMVRGRKASPVSVVLPISITELVHGFRLYLSVKPRTGTSTNSLFPEIIKLIVITLGCFSCDTPL